jgi:hypothetical protein
VHARALKEIDRRYARQAKKVDKPDHERLRYERSIEREEIIEQYADDLSSRLLRKARRYYVVPPRTPRKDVENPQGNEHWNYLPMLETLALTQAGIAVVQRGIEEAQARRRQKWETWAKILGGLVTGLVALGSVIVSLVLALRGR